MNMGGTADSGTFQPQFNAMNSSWGASGDYPQQENPMQSMSLQNMSRQQQDSFNPYGGDQWQSRGGQMSPQYGQSNNAGPSQNLARQQGMMSNSGNQALNQMAPQGQQQMAAQARQALGDPNRQNIANQFSPPTAPNNAAIPQQNELNQIMPSQQAMSSQNNPAGNMQAMAAQQQMAPQTQQQMAPQTRQQGGSVQQNLLNRQSMMAQQLGSSSGKFGTPQSLLNL
jgi:hypothetical protein